MDEFGDRRHDELVDAKVTGAFHPDPVFALGKVTHRFRTRAILRVMNDDRVLSRRRVERTLAGAGSLEPCGDENPAFRGSCNCELRAGIGNRRSMKQFRDKVVTLRFDRRRKRRLGTTADSAKYKREKARSNLRYSHREPAFHWSE